MSPYFRTQYPRCYGAPSLPADSALSGWIILVSAAKRQPIKKLLNNWRYPIKDVYDADVHRQIPPLPAMASMSFESPLNLARSRLLSQTILGDPELLCLTRLPDGRAIHRYCPCCLAADRTPYLRRHWRVSYGFVCEIHGCLLLDRCPSCHASINFALANLAALRAGPKHLLRLCPCCVTDLASSPEIRPQASALDAMVQAQRHIHRLVSTPFYVHPRAGTIASAKVLQSFMLVDVDDETGRHAYAGLNIGRLFLNRREQIESFLARHARLRNFSI